MRDHIVRVAFPRTELGHDFERGFRPVRPGRVAREAFVRQVRVVLEVTHRFDEIDTLTSLTARQFGTPFGGVEGGREIDVVRLLVLIVRASLRFKQIPSFSSAFVPWKNGPGSSGLMSSVMLHLSFSQVVFTV